MKIIPLVNNDKIQESLRSLTEEFIGEYPSYADWIQKNKQTFEDRTRIVYAMTENNKIVGYMMVHHSTDRCAKINGIYVFPEYQKKGYAKQSILQIIKELKNQNYDYVFIQTRLHNKIVVHMFEILHFNVIGKNYHNVEKQDNWLAVFDIKEKRNFSEMYELAKSLYPGFHKTK